jgi:hypothetical protein
MSDCNCELCDMRRQVEAAKATALPEHYALMLALYQRLSHQTAEAGIANTRIEAANHMLSRRGSSVEREAEMWRIETKA